MDFLTVLLVVLLVVGLSTTFWGLVGVGRGLGAALRRTTGAPHAHPPAGTPPVSGVAVLIAAHNEAATIEQSIQIVERRVNGDTHPGEEGASRRVEAHGAQRALMDRYGSRTGGRAA